MKRSMNLLSEQAQREKAINKKNVSNPGGRKSKLKERLLQLINPIKAIKD